MLSMEQEGIYKMNVSRNHYLLVVLVTLLVAHVGLVAKSRNDANPLPGSGETVAVDPHPSTTGGIREEIPDRYKTRYQQWKAEFLSTPIGQAQWEVYARHPHLVLTIT